METLTATSGQVIAIETNVRELRARTDKSAPWLQHVTCKMCFSDPIGTDILESTLCTGAYVGLLTTVVEVLMQKSWLRHFLRQYFHLNNFTELINV